MGVASRHQADHALSGRATLREEEPAANARKFTRMNGILRGVSTGNFASFMCVHSRDFAPLCLSWLSVSPGLVGAGLETRCCWYWTPTRMKQPRSEFGEQRRLRFVRPSGRAERSFATNDGALGLE